MSGIRTTLSVLIPALVLPTALTVSSPASAGCGTNADLTDVEQHCRLSPGETAALINSGSGARYRTELLCGIFGSRFCRAPEPCVSDGRTGLHYEVWGDHGNGWERIGVVCLTRREDALAAITPGMVWAAMRRLSWPRSELKIQPPGGETLVNLETNFYTRNRGSTRQTVTLLGQHVTIEATPARYVWHWAAAVESADAGTTETTSPGAAYPDLDVTYTYRDAQVTVHPSVDTVYSGRYRVGVGPWIAIPQTLTVPGRPVALRVMEANPVLVGG